jgi:hypothetical protein
VKTDPKTPTKRPAHELPASLPAGLKRPDLTTTVDGKLIASEFQRQLFDDIKHGQCVRCHAKDHARATCKEPVGRWEANFDENKDKYWAGTLKWQKKSQDEKTGAPAAIPPTLIQKKKESRRQHLSHHDADENLPLQCRSQRLAADDSEDDAPALHIDRALTIDEVAVFTLAGSGTASVFANEPPPLTTSDAAAHYHALQILYPPDSDESDDSELTPEELIEAIIESTCMKTLDGWGAEAINPMVNNPIFTILHTSNANALVMFSNGIHGVFLRSDVDAASRWIGSSRPDPRALPARATKPREVTWDPETGRTPLVPADEFSSSSISAPAIQAPPIPGTCPLPTGARPLPTVTVPADYPLVPRAPWMLEGDSRTDAEADSDWRAAMERLFPPTAAPTPPLPAWRQAQIADLDRPSLPPAPWPPNPWGSTPATEPSREPDSYLSHRNGRRTAMIRAIDPDHLLRHEPPSAPGPRPVPTQDYDSDDSLQSYASATARRPRTLRILKVQEAVPSTTQPQSPTTPPSSFRGGNAVSAFCTVRDPTVPDPLATRSILIGLDSYSDVTVAHREIAYNIHRVAETVQTGAGEATYQEEGLVDIVDGLYSFRTIPALIARTHEQLPSSTHLLLGVQQINDLDLKCDVHRKQRRLPLQSYNPDSDFAFNVSLQCRLAEKDLVRWAEYNPETPVGTVRYSYLDVDINPALNAEERAALLQAGSDYASVFDAAKGALPALAEHPPVDLNFKSDWKHVSVPTPKWGPGAVVVLSRWAKEMLACGLYTKSKSPSASRPHTVCKTPQDAPKDIDIRTVASLYVGITGKSTTSFKSRFQPQPTERTSSPNFLDTTCIGSRIASACTTLMPYAPARRANFLLSTPPLALSNPPVWFLGK